MPPSVAPPLTWRTIIQQPNPNVLKELILKALSSISDTLPPPPSPSSSFTSTTWTTLIPFPLLRVSYDLFPQKSRALARQLLGIEFSTTGTPCLRMTVLQFSVLCCAVETDRDGARAAVVEMFLQVSTLTDINANHFGDRSNVLHLAAFLKMEWILDQLVKLGGDDRQENGRGLDASEILEIVQVETFNLDAYLTRKLAIKQDGADEGQVQAVFNPLLMGNHDNGLENAQDEEVNSVPRPSIGMTRHDNKQDREEEENDDEQENAHWHRNMRQAAKAEVVLNYADEVYPVQSLDYHRSLSGRHTPMPTDDSDEENMSEVDSCPPEVSHLIFDGQDTPPSPSPPDTPDENKDEDENEEENEDALIRRQGYMPRFNRLDWINKRRVLGDRQAPYRNPTTDEVHDWILEKVEAAKKDGTYFPPAEGEMVRSTYDMIRPSSFCNGTTASQPLISAINPRKRHSIHDEDYLAYVERMGVKMRPFHETDIDRSIHWALFRCVRTFQKHINQPMEDEGEGYVDILEEYEEEMGSIDQDRHHRSVYDNVRPMTPMVPRGNNLLQGIIYGNGHNQEASPRPLPVIPGSQRSKSAMSFPRISTPIMFQFTTKKSKHGVAVPTTLDLSGELGGRCEVPAKDSKANRVASAFRSPRLTLSPYSSPVFSQSEPLVGSEVANADEVEQECQEGEHEDAQGPDVPSSPPVKSPRLSSVAKSGGKAISHLKLTIKDKFSSTSILSPPPPPASTSADGAADGAAAAGDSRQRGQDSISSTVSSFRQLLSPSKVGESLESFIQGINFPRVTSPPASNSNSNNHVQGMAASLFGRKNTRSPQLYPDQQALSPQSTILQSGFFQDPTQPRFQILDCRQSSKAHHQQQLLKQQQQQHQSIHPLDRSENQQQQTDQQQQQQSEVKEQEQHAQEDEMVAQIAYRSLPCSPIYTPMTSSPSSEAVTSFSMTHRRGTTSTPVDAMATTRAPSRTARRAESRSESRAESRAESRVPNELSSLGHRPSAGSTTSSKNINWTRRKQVQVPTSLLGKGVSRREQHLQSPQQPQAIVPNSTGLFGSNAEQKPAGLTREVRKALMETRDLSKELAMAMQRAEAEAEFKKLPPIPVNVLAYGTAAVPVPVARTVEPVVVKEVAEEEPVAEMAVEMMAGIWKDPAMALSERRTLSNCESPAKTHTGSMYIKIQSLVNFSLPIPDEDTMVSIRIDTGLEKIDTDYIHLDCIDMPFNTEFHLPVTPDLAITLTVHLMQAPHLQPRYYLPELDEEEPRAEFSGSAGEDEGFQILDYQDFEQQHIRTVPKASRKKQLLHKLLFKKSPSSPQSTLSSIDRSTISSPLCDSTVGSTWSPQSTRDLASGSGSAQEGNCSESTIGPSLSSATSAATARKSSVSSISKWTKNLFQGSSIQRTSSPLQHQQERQTPSMKDKKKSFSSLSSAYNTAAARLTSTRNEVPVNVPPYGHASLPSRNTTKNWTQHQRHATLSRTHYPSPSPSPTMHSTCTLSSSELTLGEIQTQESPLQVLSRHILFDDENCIGRSGIMFSEVRDACQEQIRAVDFVVINNWTDKTDYRTLKKVERRTAITKAGVSGELVGQDSRHQSALWKQQKVYSLGALGASDHPEEEQEGEEEGEEEEEGSELEVEFNVGRISTLICFIPGQVMDPEDAIYEEDPSTAAHLLSEPQNMVQCHQGLQYFRWQNQMVMEGRLFFLLGEQNDRWEEGLFRLVGSKLWRCRNGKLQHGQEQRQEQEQGSGWENEKVAYLDLEEVVFFQTTLGVFDATPRYLDAPLSPCSLRHRDAQQQDLPLLVENGFRLRVRVQGAEEVKEGQGDTSSEWKTQDFYAQDSELAQAWVAALMGACRDGPPRPTWL